jgi:hemerythrin-like domain-containing protein
MAYAWRRWRENRMAGLGQAADADVRPAFFARRSRARPGTNRMTFMKLTDALIGEHGLFYALFDQIEAVVAAATSVAQLQETTLVLRTAILSHSELEDELLIPILEPHMGTEGPLAVMRAEHDEIKSALQQLEEARNLEDGVDCVARVLSLLRDHFQKEEEILFSVARQVLDDETQIRLGKAWAEARRVTIA